MALFKKKGDNLSRAGSILDALAPKDDNNTPPVVEPNTPPVEEPNTPPVVEPNTPPVEEPSTPPAAEPNTPPVDVVPGEEPVVVATPPVDVPKPDAVVEPTVTEISDDLIFEKLSEKLGREIKSLDDLKQKELDSELVQLKEWKDRTGLPLSEWSDYNRDFSKMGDLDVAREILAKQYPDFTQEELNYSLQNFVYNEDEDDDSDKIKKSIALKKFAKEGRDKLEANRLNLLENSPKAVLTQEQQDAIAFAQQVRQNEATITQAQTEYNNGIAQASTALDSIDLKLSDDLTIKYNVPAEVKKNLPKTVAEMPHWYNEDGSYNHSNVVKDVAKVTNFEAIVKAAYEQGIAVGKEGQIKVGANVTIDGTPTNTPPKESKSNVQDVVAKLTGASRGGKLRFGKVNK